MPIQVWTLGTSTMYDVVVRGTVVATATDPELARTALGEAQQRGLVTPKPGVQVSDEFNALYSVEQYLGGWRVYSRNDPREYIAICLNVRQVAQVMEQLNECGRVYNAPVGAVVHENFV